MFKINRTTEYGLIALQHLCQNAEKPASAREISDRYDLPFEITAKTLQRLKDHRILQSAQGARGGYTLRRSPEDLTLGEFLKLMEGPQAVVTCSGDAKHCGGHCEYERRCEIRSVMNTLNHRVIHFLQSIRLSELLPPPSSQPRTQDVRHEISDLS